MDKEIFRGVAVDEGSGLQMYRVLGTPQLDIIDPLLMLDEFRADRSVPGFPPHPHRGIETITYLRSGRFRHADSSGNKGILEGGGVQWMRAAGGIIHEEEPLVEAGKPVHGFQLWLNMPRANKRDIPEYEQFFSCRNTGHRCRTEPGKGNCRQLRRPSWSGAWSHHYSLFRR
jgi:redox-sensitive bicupin YhaK (pirin superfamily)